MLVDLHDDSYPCVVNYVKGINGIENLVACCRACSRIKQNIDTRSPSLKAVRKWVNKERFRLGYSYNKEWMNSDAEELVSAFARSHSVPSLETILVDTTLTPAAVSSKGEEIENETPEELERIERNAEILREKCFGKIDAQRRIEETMSDDEIRVFLENQESNAKRVIEENRALEEKLRNVKREPRDPSLLDSPLDD